MTNVFGTWRLVKATAHDAGGKELPPPYGGEPMGRIVLGANGRMMALICDNRKEMPPGEKREYGGYCGNFTYDGKRLVPRAAGAPPPSRRGPDQFGGVRSEATLMVPPPPLRD